MAGVAARPSMFAACMRHALAVHRQPLKMLMTAGPPASRPFRSLYTVAVSAADTVVASLARHIQHNALHVQQLRPPVFSRQSLGCQFSQTSRVRNTHAGLCHASPWDDTWEELMDELTAKGYATDAGSDDWGASKRALLAFARSDNLLPAIGLDCIKALVATDIQYMDRKVRNARQRLSLLGGDTAMDIGTGEPSFQDVLRLLMAIHLAGNDRTPDNEAAGTPVLRQALQCLRSQPTAPAALAKTSPLAVKSPVSAPQRQGGRGTKQQQARSWEAAP